MNYPEFYDRVAPIRLYDPLADFLGATEGGVIEISYLDCVKLAGHSCPTVAGSYIMTCRALERLYGEDGKAVRSEIEISLGKAKTDGVTGVIGNVAAFICGASDEGGFAGIGGRFSRKSLLSFGHSDMEGDITFKRRDNDRSVSLSLDTSAVPGNPEMMPLMQKSLQGLATTQERERFASLWQARVEYMLTHRELWPEIAKIV
jgi:hypothetical protein